jgi:hypothetical protein
MASGFLRRLKQNHKMSKFFGKGLNFFNTFFLLDSADLRRNPPIGAETRFLNTSGGEPIPLLKLSMRLAFTHFLEGMLICSYYSAFYKINPFSIEIASIRLIFVSSSHQI